MPVDDQQLDLPPLARQVATNRDKITDNAIGWKLSTIIAVLALVYSILYNNIQDKALERAHYVTIEEAQCMVYEHLTGKKDPIHECP